MDKVLFQVWVYLSASPLLWLTATLLGYLLARHLQRLAGGTALLHPVALTVGLLIGLLTATGTSYAVYFNGAQFVHFLLGPATVSLAVPIYRERARLRRLWRPISAALLAGVTAASLSAVGLGLAFGLERATLLSLAPKSVTAPVAMGIAEQLGGHPSLTAALVVTTGILGAILGMAVFRLLGVRDEVARGFAMGVAAHGIGTARAFQSSPTMGACAGLAMALSACIAAWILPPLLAWLGV